MIRIVWFHSFSFTAAFSSMEQLRQQILETIFQNAVYGFGVLALGQRKKKQEEEKEG